jgi:oxalate decarboxylase/phosphoglucose isomerase-like protein (cupin superfamily)
MKYISKIKPEFVDDRGSITKLLDDGKTNIKSILLITSKRGSVRSNHYHKKDAHWIYIISGKMEYYEKPVKGRSRMKKVTVGPGGMVYTPSMAIHATKFLEDSVIMAFSIKSRHQSAYEKDTVRIKLI